MYVILFAHSLTSVISLNPSLQHPCLPVSLVYLSVVPSFTSSPDCFPYPCLPSSPPPLFCVCYSVCLPPPPVMYGFTPCTPPSCFQLFPLTYCASVIILFSNSPTCITPPPLYHNPIFFLLSLPYFVSMILFATHHHLYDSLPSTTAPCLCSYPLPQFCVCYYCD